MPHNAPRMYRAGGPRATRDATAKKGFPPQVSDAKHGAPSVPHGHHGHPKDIIGWTEYIDFPDWHIAGMKAKVDTGARTSALHVEDLKTLSDGRVRFHVILSRKNQERRVTVTAPVLKWARVRSSTGVYRRRCFVMARVRIGHVEKEIEVSLVSRERMLFRMLLGRKAIERDFLVDVSKRSVITERPKKAARRITRESPAATKESPL